MPTKYVPTGKPPGRPRGPQARKVTPEMQMAARAAGTPAVETHEDIYGVTETERSDSRDRGTVEHTTRPRARVYKRTASGYFEPRIVPIANIGFMFRDGALARCPHCGSDECEGKNSCPGRAKRGYRVCPIDSCGKHIYDNPDALKAPTTDEEDDALIRDDSYATATPAERTRALMDIHILTYHPQESRYLGVTGQVRDSFPTAFTPEHAEELAGV